MTPASTHDDQSTKPHIGRREVAVFLLLLACNWLVVLLFSGAQQRVAIPYSPTFLAQVEAGNVSAVTAQDAAIQGTFRHAIRYERAPSTTAFSTRVPVFADTKGLDALLEAKGVTVSAKAPPGTPFSARRSSSSGSGT